MAGRRIHQSSLEHIHGRSTAHSDESSTESAEDMSRGGIGIHTNILHCNLLELIIGGKLCSINDRISHDVWNNTNPQSEKAGGVNNFFVAIHDATNPSLHG